MGWGSTRRSTLPTARPPSRWLAGFSHWPLFGIGLLLTAFGVLMIYSSSAVMGLQKYGDSLYYVKKQALFLAGGWVL